MARLYADENFLFPVVEELRRLGHDVLTLQETGHGRQSVSDELVLEYATREERILLTMNRKHFIALHKTSRNHSGIVVCSFDPQFGKQAHRIHQTLETCKGTFTGELLRVNRPQPS
jgi:hypothetical protein